jgi:hypothetical protein
MKMNLNHEEINEAIVDWVAKQGIDLKDKAAVVELTAGRSNGNSAAIDIKPLPVCDVTDADPETYPQCEVSKAYPPPIPDDDPQEVGEVTEVEPTIPDDTSVLHTDF